MRDIYRRARICRLRRGACHPNYLTTCTGPRGVPPRGILAQGDADALVLRRCSGGVDLTAVPESRAGRVTNGLSLRWSSGSVEGNAQIGSIWRPGAADRRGADATRADKRGLSREPARPE